LRESKYTVEFEDFCSGRGLVSVYNYLAKDNAPHLEKAEEVINRLKLNPPCQYALEAATIHYRFLLRNAQMLCIITQAKGVFLAGDNQVHNKDLVFSIAQTLKEEFHCHDKTQWLHPVKVFSQTKPSNLNIMGTLLVAKQG